MNFINVYYSPALLLLYFSAQKNLEKFLKNGMSPIHRVLGKKDTKNQVKVLYNNILTLNKLFFKYI